MSVSTVDKSSHHKLIISTGPRHVHTKQNLIIKDDTCTAVNNKQLAESEHYQQYARIPM